MEVGKALISLTLELAGSLLNSQDHLKLTGFPIRWKLLAMVKASAVLTKRNLSLMELPVMMVSKLSSSTTPKVNYNSILLL